MHKIIVLAVAGLILLGILYYYANIRDDSCSDEGECSTCQYSWFYNLVIPGIVVVGLFLYSDFKNRGG